MVKGENCSVVFVFALIVINCQPFGCGENFLRSDFRNWHCVMSNLLSKAVPGLDPMFFLTIPQNIQTCWQWLVIHWIFLFNACIKFWSRAYVNTMWGIFVSAAGRPYLPKHSWTNNYKNEIWLLYSLSKKSFLLFFFERDTYL